MRTWRTQKRQPQIRDDGVSEQRCELPYYLQIKAAKRNGDPSHKHKLIRSCDQGYGRSWATREAAAASRQDFKVWVDKGCPGMHLAQQAAKDARDRPKQAGQSSGTPTRFSERAKVNQACRAVLKLTVQTLAAGAAVTATVACGLAPMDPAQLDAAWRNRSAFLIVVRTRRVSRTRMLMWRSL